MNFAFQSARIEVECKVIEAEGARDAQNLVASSLNANVLKYLGIQAAKDLSLSNNAKTVITDGKNPMILGGGQ